MTEVLYGIMRIIAKIHNYIMHLNDRFEYNFSDKDMHFLVIGLLGMLMIFVVYPLFKWLAQKKHIMVIAWIYVFTLILVITFAIEIGQKISNTGNMEFADIVFGVMGFIVMFAVFTVIRGIYHGIRWLFNHKFVEKKLPENSEKESDDEDKNNNTVEEEKLKPSQKTSVDTVNEEENDVDCNDDYSFKPDYRQYEYEFSDEDKKIIADLTEEDTEEEDSSENHDGK